MNDLDDNNLLPCPFCGRKPIESFYEAHEHNFSFMPDYPGAWVIECISCEFRIFDNDCHDNAVKKWNRRIK